MTSRIRIKMGAVEVDCEGSEQFLKKELPDLLAAVSELNDARGRQSLDESDSGGIAGGNGERKAHGTTATIAGKLNCKTGPDLVIAAAAHLTFESNQNVFSREDLLRQAKAATAYYKQSVSKNLTATLNSRVKAGVLVEQSRGNYALSATKRKELRDRLAT